MYIVNQGTVQVVGGFEGNQVLAELGPGSVFGEIRSVGVVRLNLTAVVMGPWNHLCTVEEHQLFFIF